MWFTAMFTFAGNTATRSAMIPHAAARRRRGHGTTNPMLPASSATTEIYTNARGAGQPAGIIAA